MSYIFLYYDTSHLTYIHYFILIYIILIKSVISEEVSCRVHVFATFVKYGNIVLCLYVRYILRI